MEEKLIELISNYQGIEKDSISLDSKLINDLGLSSYDIVDLACQIEDEFGKEIPDDKIRGLQTVQDIVDLLNNL